MASSYVNDLRLNEMATGDASGTWGTNTNVNLNLISEALGYGTEGITTNADTHTSTIADGATDPVRAMYVEYTGTLDSACTITIAPNTINRMQFIENGTSGSQNIIISQGSGANITIPPGDVKAVYLDGAGSGAAVVDAFASLNVVDLKVQDDLTVTGDIDVDGTTNLDNTDIDGTLDVSGQVTFADGSAGAPSISNTGDVNAGLFFSAADVMSFSAGGTAQFTMADGSISPVTDNDIDLGTASLKYKSFFAGLVDAENFKINGGQGSDGQVLTSTGSGVAFEDAGGGPTFKEVGTNFADSLMVGADSTGTLNAAEKNTALGIGVFAALTSGDSNVALGFDAGKSITTGGQNVLIGSGAGDAITTGQTNIAIGQTCLGALVDDDGNVAVGDNAMQFSTDAQNNVSVGQDAGRRIVGTDNVAIGEGSMITAGDKDQNTAVGASSLAANTTASGNTAVGFEAGDANTTGSALTAVGFGALGSHTTGDSYTGIGYLAGRDVTTGGDSVFVGRSAGQTHTTGTRSVAVGVFAGGGTGAKTGSNNTSVGYIAGNKLTSGAANVAIGDSAGAEITEASNSTCVGEQAGSGITTGSNNICLGRGAATTTTTGTQNIVIGTGANTGNGGSVGRIVLGGGIDGTSDNRITIGSVNGKAELDLDGSDTSWAASSDERLKENIQETTAGLSFINDLKPVTFDWKKKKDITPELENYFEADSDDRIHGYEGTTYHGFIAQETQSVINNHPEIKNGLGLIKNRDDGVLTAAPGSLIPILVKSIQELSTKIEELQAKLGE